MKNFEEDFQIFDTKASARPITIPSTYNDRTRLVYEAARCGVRDFFRKNGYRKPSIGLSGGIDSAVVASIAVDALGAENVRALLMPSPFSSLESVEDAKELARNLGIEYNVIPISEIYTSVVNTLKPVIGGTEFDSTEENIQTRIRTVLLMALQNKTGHILLNSSNKSENALGLCTLYGDTAGAFSPTGDLYKSEMYDVARYINRTMGNPIPESILTKEPSSELHPGQKDSDILPPYEVVDAILFRMIEEMLGKPIEIKYQHDPNSGHYQITPYAFMPKVGRKMTPHLSTELGQGVLKVMEEIHQELHPDLKELGGYLMVDKAD